MPLTNTASDLGAYRATFQSAHDSLVSLLTEQIGESKYTTPTGEIFINPSKDRHYLGVWPDDSCYPLMSIPELMTNSDLESLLAFLTSSIVDLGRLPDRVETDGMPILSPGMYDSPHTNRMPLHLPAAWIRFLDYYELRGVKIPSKEKWARVILRSYEQVPFACGLVYMDPQFPCVGYCFYDGVAITGWDLVTSLVHYRGFQRAARLFRDVIDAESIALFESRAAAIAANLHRLYDARIGGFVSGSRDCHQFSVWGNGLAYWFVDQPTRQTIVDFYRKNYKRIFVQGCTRQITEESGWQRMLTSSTLGEYMNGGAWPTGTGYVLPAIADQCPGIAAELATDLVKTVSKKQSPEWIRANGEPGGVKQFNASIAVPLLGLKSILDGIPLIDFF